MLEHRDRIGLGLPVAVEVLELFARQGPDHLEAACVRWLHRHAAEAHGQRLADFGGIVAARDALTSEPEFGTDELPRLCDGRGLGPASWYTERGVPLSTPVLSCRSDSRAGPGPSLA